MAMDFNKTANEFLNSPAGAKLSGKKDELNQLINSPEGQNVKNMLNQDEGALMTALEKGDMAVLKKALTNILKTEDGSKIAEQVMKMMN
jgi:hypothetical protein